MYFSFDINKLGPVRNSNVTFNQFLLFTGNSNTGKSYVALLFYYFIKHIGIKLIDFVKISLDIETLKAELELNKSVKVNFDSELFHVWINTTAGDYLSYLLKREELECDVRLNSNITAFDIDIEIKTSNKGVGNVHNFIVFGETYTADVDFPLDLAVARLMSIAIRDHFLNIGSNSQALILPPARGALMGFSFSDKTTFASTGMYKEFLTDYDRITASKDSLGDELLQTTINKCIDGDLEIQNDEIYYKHQTEPIIPLSAVASSIKELSPIVMVLKKIATDRLSIMFEEPEAHLHPALQVDIAKIISYLVNKGAYLQITTHSDLILTKLNHLLRLGRLRKRDREAFSVLIEKIGIEEYYVLDEENVSAYYFEKTGDGFTRISQQNLADGIPFDTFKKTYDHLYKESNLIDEFLAPK
jgi:hypothetical protein